MNLVIGERYNFVDQAERLFYIGRLWDRGTRWHQFALVEEPTVVWSEILESDLFMIEETT